MLQNLDIQGNVLMTYFPNPDSGPSLLVRDQPTLFAASPGIHRVQEAYRATAEQPRGTGVS